MKGLSIVCLALVLVPTPSSLAADGPAQTVLDLWPGAAPGDEGASSLGEEKAQRKGEVIASITNVSKPTLTVWRPDPAKNTGVAIVVCPGGGYNVLAWDHEGEQVARWLNGIGVTAAVLKYRVPRRPGAPRDQPPPQALMDAQRALSLVRNHAEEWGLDAKRIGLLGFSAGGHLTTWASTNADKRSYESVDAADKVSCRPDFAVIIYPGGVTKRGTDQLAPEIRISSETPPVFLALSADDRIAVAGSLRLFQALQEAKVPVELHIYATGGHGYGMRATGKPHATWPQRCEEWMRDQGILKRKEGATESR
jgi:acetyl esterase/lipase